MLARAASGAAAAAAPMRTLAVQQVRTMAITAEAVRIHSHGKAERVMKKETVEVNDQVSGSQVLIKMLAAPVSPYDISEAEGFNATKGAKMPIVCGNQGVAEVAAVGKDVKGLSVGDWVVPTAPKVGTWASMATASADALTRVEKFSMMDANGKTDIAAEQVAATVLPALAAQRLLTDFAKLEAGDVIVLNGAKSALGQCVLQLAAEKGLVTIAIEREHSAWDETVAHWGNLNPANIAASELFTQTADFAKVLADVPAPKLGIDTEGGRSGLVVAQTVGEGATVVSVGNASGHPLPLTADVLLNKAVHVTGFSLGKWLQSAKKADVDAAVADIVGKTAQGKLTTRVSWEPFKDFSIALKRAQDAQELPIVVVMDPAPERLQ